MKEKEVSFTGQWQNILKKMAAQLNKFIGRYKKSPAIEGQINRGNELLQQKKWIEAELIFQKIKEKYSKKPWGYIGLARVADGREEWEIATRMWKELLLLFPENKNYLINLGNTYYEQKNYHEGDAVFEKLRQKFPEEPTIVPHFRRKKVGFYAQNGQDWYVTEVLFNRKMNGVFVDVGAYAGINFSNTYYLERELGWSGIAVEPNPSVFKKLQKNRSCTTLQACITDYNGTTDFLSIEGPGNMLCGIIEKYDARHMDRVNRIVSEHNGKKQPIKMQCLTINNLLEKHKLSRVDYLTIDTEGGELDILKAIDFDRFDIEVIGVENNFEETDIRKLLIGKGYELKVISGADEIYRKKS